MHVFIDENYELRLWVEMTIRDLGITITQRGLVVY